MKKRFPASAATEMTTYKLKAPVFTPPGEPMRSVAKVQQRNPIVLPGSARRNAPKGEGVVTAKTVVTICPSPAFDKRFQSDPAAPTGGPFTAYPPGVNPETGRAW